MDGLRRRVRHGCLSSRGASPGRDAASSEARKQTALLVSPPRRLSHDRKAKEKAGRSPLSRSARRSRSGLLGRGALAFLDGLHRPADAALLVDFQHLYLADVAFLTSEETQSELQSLM